MSSRRRSILGGSRKDKSAKAQAKTKDIMPQVSGERGSGISGIEQQVFGTTDNVAKYNAIEEMLTRNGIVKAILNVVILPILSTDWTIEPYDETQSGAKEQAEKVKDMLTRPSFAYGLTTPFELFREQSLRAVAHGFAVHELVWEKDNEGLFYLRKLAHRPQNTLEILRDDRGGFNGVKQKAKIGDADVEVEIPPEKLIMFTHNKASNNLHGESQLSTAWRYFQMQNDYLKLSSIQGQWKAIMPIFLQVRQGEKVSEEKLKETVEEINGVKHKGVIGLPPEMEVVLTQSGGDNWIDFMPFVDYMDNSIARAVLAFFLLLGSGSTGSYALSESQINFFLQLLTKVKRAFDSHITDFLLSKIYAANWGENAAYGVFKTADFTEGTVEMIKENVKELFRQGRASPEMEEATMKLHGQEIGVADLERYTKQEGEADDAVDDGEEPAPPVPGAEEAPEEGEVA